jgi:hypothetical protein
MDAGRYIQKAHDGIMKKRVFIGFGIILALILVAVVTAFFFLNSIVKGGIEKVGPMVTLSPVHLDSVTLSLFSGKGAIHGFTLGNPEGYKTPEAIKVAKVDISIEPSSVTSHKKIVRSVLIENPEITYETDLKGSNLAKILSNIQSTVGGSGKNTVTNQTPSAGTALQVDEIAITGGKIRVGATMLGGGAITLPLPEIKIANLGQGPEGINPVEVAEKVLSAVLNGTLKAVADNALSLGKQAGGEIKGVGTGAVDMLKKGGGGVSDLFKKK